MRRIFLALTVFVLFGFTAQNCEDPSKRENQNFGGKLETETILTDRGIIWGFAFMPDGAIIFTEKDGKIGIFKNGKITELKGVPAVETESQGGLLGIALHPDFKNNGWVYIAYNNKIGDLTNVNLARFKIKDNAVADLENLLSTSATNKWKGHNGSRIVFDDKGYLYWSVGEGGVSSRGGKDSPNQNAQNVKEGWGKIHRLTADGKIPSDNPVLPGNAGPTSIFTYGHRNPQGLVFNPKAKQMWETEHGPRGGDELNLLESGKNYGWPWVSYGINYDGVDISGKKHDGFQEPVFQWTPSIGASGLAYLTSDVYGDWKDSFFAGGLALQELSRIYFENGNAKEEVLLKGIGRVRDVVQGTDGYLYISVEGPGRILKLVPKSGE